MPVSAMRSGTEVLQAGAARLRWQRRRLVPNFALGVNYRLMARYPPQTRYAQSSGAKIAYQVSGNGPPDLVMVPGLVSHLDIQWQQTGYRRFVRVLERAGGCNAKKGTHRPAGPSTCCGRAAGHGTVAAMPAGHYR